jgi:group I intron endonuclease
MKDQSRLVDGIVYMAYRYTNNRDFIKMYIGMTTKSLDVRRRSHLYHARARWKNTHFLNALRKYGEDSFEWIVLKTFSQVAPSVIYESEIELIDRYDSYNNGYNSTLGGDHGALGFRHTDEMKEASRQRTLKQFDDPEARRKAAERTLKQFDDPEARRKAAEKTRQYFEDNPDARKRTSEAIKARYSDPEFKERCRLASIAAHDNPETRAKMSQSAKMRTDPSRTIRWVLVDNDREVVFDIFGWTGTAAKLKEMSCTYNTFHKFAEDSPDPMIEWSATIKRSTKQPNRKPHKLCGYTLYKYKKEV